MQRFWSYIAVELGKKAGAVAAIGLVLTGVIGFGITKLDFATDQDSYLNTDDQVYIDSREYQELFGGQAMLSVIHLDDDVELVDFLDAEMLTRMKELGADLSEDPGVLAAVTPYDTITLTDNLIQKDANGNVVTDPLKSVAGGSLAFAAGLSGETGPPQLQEQAGTPQFEARQTDSLETASKLGAIPPEERTFENREWREFLIYDNQHEIRRSLRPFLPDEHTVQVVTRLRGNLSIEDEGMAADHITATVDAFKMEGATSTTVGAPTLLQDINEYLRGGILSLGAIGIGVMMLILLFLFDVRWRLLPLLVITVGLIWAFGLAGYIGIPLSLVTISGLPVMMGVGIDYAIQMHSRIEEEVVIDREAHPIQEAARNLGPGLLVVTFDAVLAFAALRLARVPMIRDFGNLLMVGIIAICVNSIILPIAALGAREYKSPTKGRDFREGALGRLAVRIGSLSPKLAIPFAIMSIAILVGGVAVEDKIVIKADPIQWVDQSSETIQKIDTVTEQTGSSSELGVFVRADDTLSQDTVTYVHELNNCVLGTFPTEAEAGGGPFTQERCAQDVVEAQTITVDGKESAALLTASSIVNVIGDALAIPGATPLAPRAADVESAWTLAPLPIRLFTATVEGADTVEQVEAIKPGQDVVAPEMNLIFRTGYTSLGEGEQVVRAIDDAGGAPKGTTAVPSGLAVVGVGLLDNIEANRAQLTYYSIIFVGIFLAIRLRSLTRSVLSLVPVLIATGLASIVAWGLGLELSPMTAVGGPLVVAICTEFTSLMLLRFVEERKRGFAPQDAADVTAARTGRAFIVSGLTAMAGVAVIATSSLPLLRDFGLIVAMNVVVALFSALVILPPMLVWADMEGREWVSRRLVPEERLAMSRGGKGLPHDFAAKATGDVDVIGIAGRGLDEGTSPDGNGPDEPAADEPEG